MAAYLLFVGIFVPMVRAVMVWYFTVVLIGAALWIGSIHVSYPNQLALIWVAWFVDIAGQMLYVVLMIVANALGPNAEARLQKWFEYYPAISMNSLHDSSLHS
jgi:hypothetical protein